MSSFSKSHERDENRCMNKGLVHSLAGALLCWLPLVGLFLAISGFLRVIVRVTQAHRVKKALLTVFTLLVLAGCIGALGAEVYFYVRDPGILDDTVNAVWHALTGQEQPPWVTAQDEGLDAEDPYAGYGYDPYAVDLEDYGDSSMEVDESWDVDWDESWDDEFDDSELYGFEEDLGGEAEDPASGEEDSAGEAEGLTQIDLYQQMREEQSLYAVG